MNGVVELHEACAKHDIKPIFGCEVYFVDDHLDAGGPGLGRERNHLTLLAATDAGFRNLVKLSSAGFLEGLQRGKPTVDMGCSPRTPRASSRSPAASPRACAGGSSRSAPTTPAATSTT